jgi:hypothetical protein
MGNVRSSDPSACSNNWDDRSIGPVAAGGALSPKRSSFESRKPFTSPKITGITISVSSVDEIMPPASAPRCAA